MGHFGIYNNQLWIQTIYQYQLIKGIIIKIEKLDHNLALKHQIVKMILVV
jgi:hypothetical protein